VQLHTTRHRIKGKLTLAIQPNKPQNRVFLIVGIVLAAAAAAAAAAASTEALTTGGRHCYSPEFRDCDLGHTAVSAP